MVLKQRFAEGRTNYIDIGDSFVIQTPASAEWETKGKKPDKDCVMIITYGDRGQHTEPIYKDFFQWIYSDGGKLFMTLV